MPRNKEEFTLENLSQMSEKEEREKELKELGARDLEGAKKRKNHKKSKEETLREAVQAVAAGAEEIEAEGAIKERMAEAEAAEDERKKSAAEIRKLHEASAAKTKKLREELDISKRDTAWAEELKTKVRAGAERAKAKKTEEPYEILPAEEVAEEIKQPKKITKPKAVKKPEKELTEEDATLYFAKRLEKIEEELLNEFQYEAAEDTWWKRFRFRSGLNKQNKQRFDKLLASYKAAEESHLKRAREAGKKL